MGKDSETWKDVIGKHGDPAFNENGRYLISIPSVYEAPKTANLEVKMYKKRSREIFGPCFDCNSSSANKVFWQTIRRFRGKSLSTPTSERD